jgi:hypothetical protein
VYRYDRFFDIDEVGIVSFSEPIYRSSNREPPKRLAENEEKEEFQKYVIIDMKTPLPVENLPRGVREDYQHRILAYEVEVNISGASLVIKATSQGKNIGEIVISGTF